MNWNSLVILWISCALLVGCNKNDVPPSKANDDVAAGAPDTGESVQPERSLEERLAELQQVLAEATVASGDNPTPAQRDDERSSSAWDIAKQLLVEHPDSNEVIFLAARACASEGNLEQAVEILEGIPDGFNQAGMAANGTAAEWLIELGQYENAAEKFEKMRGWIGAASGASMIDRQLVSLYEKMGVRYKLSAALARLLDRGDIRQAELAHIRGMFEPVEPSSPTKHKLAYHAVAKAAYIALGQNPGDALETLEPHVETGLTIPAFATLYLRLLADNQRWEDYRKAIDNEFLDSESPEYWLAKGLWAFHQEDASAVRCFSEAMLRDPTNMRVSRLLAESVAATGDQETADKLFERSRLLFEAFDRCSEAGPAGRDAEKMLRAAETLESLGEEKEALIWKMLAAGMSNAREDQRRIKEQWESLESSSQKKTDPLCGLDYKKYEITSELSSTNQGTNEYPFDASWASIKLKDVADLTDLSFESDNGYREGQDWLIHHGLGSGLGVIDFNLDGFPDVYFAKAGCVPFTDDSKVSNELWMNLQGERWIDCTKASRLENYQYTLGIAVGDVNQDGMPDIVVSNIGENRLLLNQGDGTFLDGTQQYGYQSNMFTSSVAVADITGDGIPEIIDVNYIDDPTLLTKTCPLDDGTPTTCSPKAYDPAHNELFVGSELGQFRRQKLLPPMEPKRRTSLGVIVTDLDGKPGNECFIANDMVPNTLWTGGAQSSDSDGDLELVDLANLRGVAFGPYGQPSACMGVAMGDVDRNGRMDLFVTNFYNELSDLFLQSSSGVFRNSVAGYGLQHDSFETLGFGTQLADLDNDGWLDLTILNGHIHDHTQRGIPFQMAPALYRGTPGRMAKVALEEDTFWEAPAIGRTLARLDWNRDGRIDFVTSHIDRPAALLQNETDVEGCWLNLRVVGTECERDAIGTRVRVTSESNQFFYTIAAGDGYMCSNEDVVHIGVGDDSGPFTVHVTWPQGSTQEFSEITASKRYLIVEGRDSAVLVN